jgi:hypothetical protein
MVVATSSHGAVTLQNDEGTLFKANGQRLKIFLESDKSPEELDVIQFLIFFLNITYLPPPIRFIHRGIVLEVS